MEWTLFYKHCDSGGHPRNYLRIFLRTLVRFVIVSILSKSYFQKSPWFQYKKMKHQLKSIAFIPQCKENIPCTSP